MGTYADTMRALTQGGRQTPVVQSTLDPARAAAEEIESLKAALEAVREVLSLQMVELQELKSRLVALEARRAATTPPQPAPSAKAGEVVDTLPPAVAAPPSGQVQGPDLDAVREVIRKQMAAGVQPPTATEEEEPPPKKGILD